MIDRLAYLQMTNFMIYRGKHRIDFKDKDVIGIIAEYASRKKKSNRAGKSVILEAIRYGCTGASRAKRDVDLISKGKEFCEIEIGILEMDGNVRVIRRGRDIKNKGIVEIDWRTKKADSQQGIDEFLGIDDDFDLTNFFLQNDINKFMELDPAQKTKYLVQWLKNNYWAKLYDQVHDDAKTAREVLTDYKTRINTLQEELESAEDIQSKIDEAELRKKKLLKSLKSANSELKELDKGSTEFDAYDLKKQKKVIKQRLEEIQENRDKEDKIRKRIKKLKLSIQQSEEEASKFNLLKHEHYVLKVDLKDKYRINIKTLERTLEQAEKHFCGTCPILKEECDRIEKDPKQIKSWKADLDSTRNDLAKIEKQIKSHEKAVETMDFIAEEKEEANKLTSHLSLYKSLSSDEKRLKGELKSVDKALLEVSNPELQAQIKKLNDHISQLQLGLDGLHGSLGQYRAKLDRIESTRLKVEKLKEKAVEQEKKVDDLKYVAMMFGKNGIPSQEVENAFHETTEEINYVLEQLETSMQVDFTADRELTTWEDHCHSCGFIYPKNYRKGSCEKCSEPRLKKRKDEPNITILENGHESDFSMDSGGGKTFISLAVRIAITLLKRRMTGKMFPVLFFDEIDSALDEEARASIMKLITTTLTKKFGYRQIFWVSHNKKIQESVPHVLKVIRYKDHAKVNWVT